MKNFPLKIETLNVKPGEIILVKFDPTGAIKADKCKLIVDNIQKSFPNNSVLVLPEPLTLQSCSKDSLLAIIDSLTKFATDTKLEG